MSGTLNDLNEYLFEQMDRLSNDDLTEEQLEMELKRADAITRTAKTIIDNGDLAFRVKQHMDEYGFGQNVKLGLLENNA